MEEMSDNTKIAILGSLMALTLFSNICSILALIRRKGSSGGKLTRMYFFLLHLFIGKTFSRVRVRNYGRWSDLGGKNICLVKWFNINLWPIFAFASFLTWSLNCNFYSNFYNTMCWYSGKDSGLSPRRPQFKSHSQ